MVVVEGGVTQTQILSAGVRKTIQQIKEIVGNHSDSDIYLALKESNMDPNETTQKLLNQDPFHEVKRKRDKKKENQGYRTSAAAEPHRNLDHVGPSVKSSTYPDHVGLSVKSSTDPDHVGQLAKSSAYTGRVGQPAKSSAYTGHVGQSAKSNTYSDQVGQPVKSSAYTGHVGQSVKSNTYSGQVGQSVKSSTYSGQVGQSVKSSTYSDRNRRIGYSRNALPAVSREFRVVRDNRVNQNANKESKPVESSTSDNGPVVTDVSSKSNSATLSVNQRPPFGRHAFQALNGPADSQPRQPTDGTSSGAVRKNGGTRQEIVNNATQMQAAKPSDNKRPSTTSSSNSVVGLYSSSLDPVHVPSPDSRSAAKVGAIKREVGVVGAHRQNSDPSAKLSSLHNSSLSSTQLGREGSSSRETFRSNGPLSKSEQTSQNTALQSAIPNLPVSRSFSNNQQSSRSHQLTGHQKAAQPNKEWKPKSNQKSTANGPGVIGMPKKSSPSIENSKDVASEVSQVEDKVSRVNMLENQNVIIAAHIRVSETEHSRLTFGSLGADFETRKSEEPHTEPSECSASESSSDEAAGSKPLDLVDDHVRNSGSGSPASVSESEQLNEKKEGSPENYSDIGLVQDTSLPYVPPESQQQQEASQLQNFSPYDTQNVYEIPYFRPTMDEHVRGQGLLSPQEALGSHPANSMPSSSIAMVQQQQAVAQMYPPQLHVSQFPYRQYPFYVPPPTMVSGYSSNAAVYPHPSNGGGIIVMPGGNSHLTSKYGIQQFKPIPTGGPTGFGNFTSPTGYAVNTPGIIGSATGLEDTSRLKYKDLNLYVPNPQAETSEIWMNQRDLQSASYYNMAGQTPHTAYLPSHSGHTTYNAAAAAVAQSTHMQFPGMYHSPMQPAAMGNPHHLGPAMGGNVGVGVAAAAPGAQVGAYQQPQLGHMNWTTGNF